MLEQNEGRARLSTRRRSGSNALNLGGLLAVLSLGTSCVAGKDYQRPKVTVVQSFRGNPGPSTATSIAEQSWADVFTDRALRGLIQTALHDNFDVRIAASRVLQAEAQYGITKSYGMPTVDANASAGAARARLGGRGEPNTGGLFQLGATVSWEIDFWGRYKRASEAARAQILASQWGQRAVVTSLVSRIAVQYFQLRAYDHELEIAENSLVSRKESLRLTQVRDTGGAGTLVDVKQAEQLVLGANASIIDLKRLIEQQENALSVLTGGAPGPIGRGQELTQQQHVTDVPTGLPSALLERRPDIQAAEQRLVAANAQVGVAKAQYFPNIHLTASGGVASASLSTLFSAPALVWSAAAGATQPIFEAGRLDAQLKLTEEQRAEAVLIYRQTIVQAFREVSDALVGYQRDREYRTVQEDLVQAASEARRLADLRYQGGASSYLEVLDSETRLFTAELALVQAELNELGQFVEIYRALGGGWHG
ncbi:MAG TPA: efflux transporter outer membrane subunit [Polyangiaceae bacterium]|nr:efflux transporter outer membrane subunit [Polyangiaceae bacterium]